MKALLIMLLVSLTTMGADLKVYPNAMAPDFDNIQDALNAAVDGDKIFIDTVTFVGNISINKSVALYPLHKGGMFTVNGSTTLSFDNFRNIELHGMNGASLSSNGNIGDSATVLISGCFFSSSSSLTRSKLISYVYYSSFTSLYVKRSELIGNTFNHDVNVDLENTSDFKMKVYGNYFGTSDGISISSAQNCFVHIANNIFNYNSSYECIYVHGNSYADNVIIENNTFNSYGYSYDIIKCYEISNLIIRNNYFKVISQNNTQDIYTTSVLIYEFKNNLISASSSYFNRGAGSLSTIENNIYSVTPTFSTSTGVISDAAYQNTGADIPECRDIDNTVNDVGTYGGPHSWDNYHSNSNSKAQILDLEIPYYNIILPGNQISIKSKAVHKQ
ncbi:MAG: hypothetical protein HN535_00185 [Flavobacteriales bacterium]|nr:hypothetical protein [Flavobacteriales bacterium]